MNNDAEAEEIHGTVASSGRFPDPAADDRAEPSDVADRDEDLDQADEEDLDREHDVTDPAGRATVNGEAGDEVVDPDAVVITETDAVIIDEDGEDLADGETPEPVTGFARTPVASPASATAAGADESTGQTEADADARHEAADAEADADAEQEPAGIGAGSAATTAGTTTAGTTTADADAVPETDVIAEAARPGVPRHAGVAAMSGLAGDPEQVHQRWSAIQAAFVDDPRASVADAAEFVGETIAALIASVQERERTLRGEWEDNGADTEDLRKTLRGYRDLLDQLIGS